MDATNLFKAGMTITWVDIVRLAVAHDLTSICR